MDDVISRPDAIDLLDEQIAICNRALTSPSISMSDEFAVNVERNSLMAYRDKLKCMPSAQPEQRWIPCSERLPEHGGRYLISVLDGINRRTTVAPYLPRCKAWAMNGRMAYWKVIAWLPLPEPYREVSE